MAIGRATRQASIQTTGSPNWAPSLSQSAEGGGDGGGRSAAGSDGSGGPASGPKPARPTTTNRTHTTIPSAANAKAISIGVALSGPSASVLEAVPVPIAASAQASGWRTLATTAATVRATMIATNGRLPRPLPAGTLIAR